MLARLAEQGPHHPSELDTITFGTCPPTCDRRAGTSTALSSAPPLTPSQFSQTRANMESKFLGQNLKNYSKFGLRPIYNSDLQSWHKTPPKPRKQRAQRCGAGQWWAGRGGAGGRAGCAHPRERPRGFVAPRAAAMPSGWRGRGSGAKVQRTGHRRGSGMA